MKAKLLRTGLFTLLAITAVTVIGWGVYNATSGKGNGQTAVTTDGNSAGAIKPGGSTQNVGVGDSVDFVVRDANGNIKKR